jgi:hypothetical protein
VEFGKPPRPSSPLSGCASSSPSESTPEPKQKAFGYAPNSRQSGGTFGGHFYNWSRGEWEAENEENEKQLQLFARPISTRYVTIGAELAAPPEECLIRVILKRLDGNPFTFYIDSASLKAIPTPAVPERIEWGELQRFVPNKPELLDTFISDFARPDYIGMFREFGGHMLTPEDIAVLEPRGIAPMIAWEPNEETKTPTPAEIAAGSHDAYIDEQAEILAAYGKPVVLRPYWEFNISLQTGEEPTLDPDDFVAMWKHMRARFEAAGATNVKWFWCCLIDYDREEGTKFKSEHDFFPFFPGDEYVDYVGADGYAEAFYDEATKGNLWSSLREVFFYTYHCLMGISSKPFGIGETGVSEREPGDKAEWIREAYRETLPQLFRRTAFICYFNRHNTGEEEWEVETSESSAAAFRAAVRSPLYRTIRSIAVRQEYPEDRLSVRIVDPATDKSIARWSEDEGLAENVIANLNMSGEMQGGHKEMTGSLARDPRREWPDSIPYLDVYVEGPGREPIWSGRTDKAPESDGETFLLEPAGRRPPSRTRRRQGDHLRLDQL